MKSRADAFSPDMLLRFFTMILVAFLPLFATNESTASSKRFEAFNIICYSLSDKINFADKQLQAYADLHDNIINKNQFISTRDELWRAQLGQHSEEYVEALSREYFSSNSEMLHGIEKIYHETDSIMATSIDGDYSVFQNKITALWNEYKKVVDSYHDSKSRLFIKYVIIFIITIGVFWHITMEKDMKTKPIVVIVVGIIFALMLTGCEPNCGRIKIPRYHDSTNATTPQMSPTQQQQYK